MIDIIKIKEWKERQFIMLDPGGAFKNLARAQRIVDGKIFVAYDEFFKKDLTASDIPNLEKLVRAYIVIRGFLPDLKNVELEYGWIRSHSFYENGEWVKDRFIEWVEDEYIIPINDIEISVEVIIKEIKEGIIDNLDLINKWEGEHIEECEESIVRFD